MPKGPPPQPAEYFSDQEGLRVVDRVSQALLKKTNDVIEVRSITRPLGKEDPIFQEYIKGEDSELARNWLRMTRGPAFSQYVSSDGTVTRIDIVLKHDPFSEKAVQAAKEVHSWVQPALDKSGVGDATVHIGGVSSQLADLTRITKKDIRRLRWQVLLVLYVILAIMLRGVIAPLYLLATMVLNYFATVGIIQLIFVNWLGADGLDWKVEFFLFVLLVAIGVDYNIYIMSRLHEETKRRPFRQALQHAIVFTGSIISSCGIIMAGTFASMMRSTLAVMVQIGLAMALGVMTDTFLVRPLLVPALALLVEKVKERIRGTRPSP
jgi:RND superfamily putative drug exporter